MKKILNTSNEPYINEFISNINSKDVPFYLQDKRLPIGNMTSQILAIYYLSELDHFIKEKLKIKHYIRYMDDLIILDNNRENLVKYKEIIKGKINDYKLEINNKSNIFSLKHGVNYLGYRYILSNKKIKIKYNKQTMKRINRRLKFFKKTDINKFVLSISSYKGYLIYSNTNLYKNKYKIYEGDYMKIKEKHNFYKSKYKEYIILIKQGIFYKVVDDDAILMWHIFNYQIKEKTLGFPLESLKKIELRLQNMNINYLVVNDEEEMKKFEINGYSKYLNEATTFYSRYCKKLELIELLDKVLFKNEDNYKKIKSYLFKMDI